MDDAFLTVAARLWPAGTAHPTTLIIEGTANAGVVLVLVVALVLPRRWAVVDEG